ncbi:MAG: hypothetical protein WCX31_21960 [Salinivirgaceae bacterium]|jgi:hypothetical protein
MKEHLEALFSGATTPGQKIAKMAIMKTLDTHIASTVLRPDDLAKLGLSWNVISMAAEGLKNQKISVSGERQERFLVFKKIKVHKKLGEVMFELDMEFFDFLFTSFTTTLKPENKYKVEGIDFNALNWN